VAAVIAVHLSSKEAHCCFLCVLLVAAFIFVTVIFLY
jgi:hypothetical protein